MSERKCLGCGDRFQAVGNMKYCGKEKFKACPTCGRAIYDKCSSKARKFCSHECSSKLRNKECAHCKRPSINKYCHLPYTYKCVNCGKMNDSICRSGPLPKYCKGYCSSIHNKKKKK